MKKFSAEASVALCDYPRALCLALLVICSPQAVSQEEDQADVAENASNPLARVKNTDVRYQYFDLSDDQGRINDSFVDGAFMINPKLKIKYELHYWETNVTGRSESGFESAVVKVIYFPREGILDNGIKYRLAVGLDLIADFDNHDKGIGMGADQLGHL